MAFPKQFTGSPGSSDSGCTFTSVEDGETVRLDRLEGFWADPCRRGGLEVGGVYRIEPSPGGWILVGRGLPWFVFWPDGRLESH